MPRRIGLLGLLLISASVVPAPAIAGQLPKATSGADATVIQPPPAVPPKDAIEEAMRFRKGEGLRSDRDYVISVGQNDAATVDDFGYPLTPDELAYLNDRLKAREEVGALRAYTDGYPDTFAGMYFDNQGAATAGVALKLVASFTADPESHRKALEALMPPGSEVDVQQVGHTYRELGAIVRSVPKERAWFESLGVIVYSAGIDETRNKVLLGISRDDEDAAKAIAERYGADRLYVFVDSAPQLDACTRTACPPPWPAGLRINDPDGFFCTSGFNVRSSSGNWYMLTAGHCPDDHWYHNGTFMGATPAGFNEFQSGSHADIQAFDIAQANHSNSLLTGTKTCNPCSFRTMTSRQLYTDDVVGDTTCISGAFTGSNCGTLQVRSETYFFAEYNAYLFEQRVADYVRTPGDSGGPIFSGTKALGSHVNFQGTLSWGVYTHIRWAEVELGLNMCFSGC